MKNNFFKTKSNSEKQLKSEFINAENLEESELLQYDKNVDFFYTNLINSLILFTYNSEELEKMEFILIDPLTELYEEMDYAFLPVCFETIFRNNIIEDKYKEEFVNFKKLVNEIPNEIWDYEFIGKNKKWMEIKNNAENLLNKLKVETRVFNTNCHKIITNEGKTIFDGKNE
ncbi:MAG: hypothetical protein IPH74_04285 [Bacteroidetes bacterium]|nr:hypothetical protein [Bacteroidota bacterium]MBK7639292.1 hypothetical protein [Bacteroidota bacterium]MBK9355105.1 hypothetical protein [Bacteroidota bacterium]MBK9636256.1 hypothetical protein [Bacteroidota bacterium]MBL0079867.1 hypothetical protein [Bacteroidota bacterium]